MRIILSIVISFFCCSLFAQNTTLHYDSASITVLHFKDSAFNEYSKDKNFQYDTKIVEKPSIWERFWNWVWGLYEDLLNAVGEQTLNVIMWVVIIAVILFFVFKVTKMNRLALFKDESRSASSYNITSEDIHSIPFDEAINEALNNGNYRLAIRLLYLQNLKLLADRNLIAWQPNKTNTDYWREITNESSKHVFKHVTNIFEYAWYGSHIVSRNDFTEMKDELTKFQNRL